MPIQIIPAILPQSFSELEEKMSQVNGLVPLVQIDICDGKYTPKATWPYRKHDDSFDAMMREEIGMPFWEDLDFEIDLMARNPEALIPQWVTAGAQRIIIHADSTDKLGEVIDSCKNQVEVGVAIGLTTPLEKILPYIADISVIQCMGISKIGFQGQNFNEQVYEKIKEVRQALPDIEISVDGGVTLENAQKLIEAGATRLAVGSAIFGEIDIHKAISEFQERAV
ncbi:hypothetical protein EPO17_03210 [Patescibacteria group bacterium]|nr:MAG: hypothetical protein EPO17_03210 [Patescibacteria group bacterium]